jgi:hypothetical protein
MKPIPALEPLAPPVGTWRTALRWSEATRGVARVHRMSLRRGVWKLGRHAPGFHQRFERRLADHGRTLRAFWERSTGGRKWTHDFDLTFTKLGRRRR